ncbi:related to succinyl-coa ligase [gdp-forming] beta-chain, mitochondrial precursor [Ustilago trichophora]|uniref:Related to succinyl-coa ligase [gdp-forming] beta-chain, mitochondrial n=1 Tax=Ustilago trichophora TaxID=86804 RepID=A0A5C3DY08_9BASI|nr:related to succinyl-coa ligase [gdp-forming] beta-chain, mitochondrial precursor [Ustilago trichophora]
MLSWTPRRAMMAPPRWKVRNIVRLPLAATRTPSAIRDFHLERKDIPTFLSKAGAKLPSSIKIEPSAPSTVASEGVAVLISADRDPQSSWPGSSGGEKRKFYGPSIFSAPLSALSALDSTYFGKGGLGLLKLRQTDPTKLTHAGVRSTTSTLPTSQLDELVHGLGEEAKTVVQEMWKLFDTYEGLWFSFILVPCSDGSLCVTAPYMEFDDFAVRRQPLLKPYFESRPRNPNTARAEDGGLFYVKLSDVDAPTPTQAEGKELPEGNVGCFGYGAGNAMATMDGLNKAGGRPANFLDGGGGANRVNAKLAVETLNRDPAVKAIFVNTFGGITRTDIVSQGIIDAVKDDKITKPIVVRMKGTGSEDAAKVLQASGLEFAFHDDFNAAAAHAVKAANQGHL